jgi:hypothetical protein
MDERIILQWIVSETSSGEFPLLGCCWGQRDEALKFVNGGECLYKVHNSRLLEGKLLIYNLSVAGCFILPFYKFRIQPMSALSRLPQGPSQNYTYICITYSE